MSLRWRLTYWSTLTLAVVFAVFSTVAFLTVRYFVYQSVDDNLRRQSTILQVYLLSYGINNVSNLSNQSQPGAVFFTLIDPASGRVVSEDRQVPIRPELISDTLDHGTTLTTIQGQNNTPIRVLLQQVVNKVTGQVYVLQAATPLDVSNQFLSEAALSLAAISVVLIIAAVIGSRVLTGRTLQAVEQITRKARQIEVSQDLSQRIPEGGINDEVGHLASTFNQMLARLEAAFEAQRRFVADSSHELRTPLTVIKSNLHLLRRTADPGEQAELITSAEAEASRLNRMVNDLLYMAQMQAGHDLKPVLRPVELDSLLLDIFARARAMAAIKNQKVILAHEDIAATMGDRDQIQHLLLNLVDNATKYTPEGGTITLGLWIDGRRVRIEVSDTGPGITPEGLPFVFDRFYRTQEARQVERNGSGLGLAIVKSIAESHNGDVEVSSAPGQGSVFRVFLPLIASTLQPTPYDTGGSGNGKNIPETLSGVRRET